MLQQRPTQSGISSRKRRRPPSSSIVKSSASAAMRRQQQLPVTSDFPRYLPRLTCYTNFLAPRLRSLGIPTRTQPPSIPPAAERRSCPTFRIQPRSCPHPRHFRSCFSNATKNSNASSQPSITQGLSGPESDSARRPPVVAPPRSSTASTTTTTTTKTEATPTNPLPARVPVRATAKLPGHRGH